MKTIGIIAEYNPFHNGHAYQIKRIKEQANADFCIVAMSGDFVQRGAPAIIDKYARTKMALSCGADVVVELPVLWATASAEDFAMAGVSLFDKMGCVDGLCFGAETENLPLLSALAEILIREPSAYREALSSYIKEGLNFPLARAKALLDYFRQFSADNENLTEIVLSEALGSPNNILALEYLKAIRRRNSSMTPYLIKREGAGYHDTDSFSKTAVHSISCASATAIRRLLLSGESAAEAIASAMPPAAAAILSEYCDTNPLICSDDFSSLLNYRLLLENSDGTGHFFDSNPDISNRLYKNRYQFVSFEQFCELNKSRDTTYTRISRVLLHILLGLTKEDAVSGKKLDYIPYFRLLGFRRSSATVLSAIKEASRNPVVKAASSCITSDVRISSGAASDTSAFSGIPVISKLANAKKLLDGPALRMLEQDIFAAELYEQVLSYKRNLIATTPPSLDAISCTSRCRFPAKKNNPLRSEFTREIVLI